MKAIARHIRISPKKANLVAGLVRLKAAKEALSILKFTPKKAAKILYKVVKSAVSNAENNFKQKLDDLMIKEIIVTEGATLKRSVPISRGRMHPILKRNSHITVIVGLTEGLEGKQTETESKKKEAKGEETKTQVKPPLKKVIEKKTATKKPKSTK